MTIIFENYWQSAKIFEKVYDIEVYPHFTLRNKPEHLSWKYVCNGGEEIHYDKQTNSIRSDYFRWRDSLWCCQKNQ